MIAGTLARFQRPLAEPLAPFIGRGDYPALTVDRTQSTVGDATPQTGQVAARIEESHTDVFTGRDQADEPYIERERDDVLVAIATDWYADVTESGVVLAESITADEELPFPFDVFGGITEASIERQQVDVEALYDAWKGTDALESIWMAGNDDWGATMAYHGSADDVDPTIGIGFKRAWNGTTIKGVCWAGGYVALYNARHPADGLGFVADEILPFAETWDPDEHEDDQADFEDFGSGGGEA